MTITLADLTYRVARALGVVYEGTATGGSTTTVVDTNKLTQADDYWNNGAIWILYDAGGAGAAPEGQYQIVSDFVSSTKTATLQSALTVAVAAGDKYAIAKKRYPLDLLIQKINEAVLAVGPIMVTDTTSLVTVNDQTEYALPLACLDLREVFIQTYNNDSNDNQWQKLTNWRIDKGTTGSQSVLIIDQYPADYKLMLKYVGYHETLRVYSDVLDESIFSERIVYQAVVGCLLWRKARVGENDTTINDLLNYYQGMSGQTAQAFPIPRRHKIKTIDLGMTVEEDRFTYPGTS